MSPSEIFVRRPVMTTLVMLGILLFGIVGYRVLPVSDLPNVDFPTILVSAGLPGANADTMASAVATPLERQFTSIAGLDNLTSASTLGSTAITLQFNLSRNINDVAPDVQAAISQAAPLLPPGMPQPPTFRKVNPADSPILYLSLTSPTLPLYTLNEYGETLMAQRISMVKGVAQVSVFGSQQYAVRIQLNPDALASRGLGLDAVENAIRQANVNLPLGTLQGPDRSFIVQASGQLTTAEPYRNLIIAYRNGLPVRLADVGRVLDSVVDDKTAAWYGDKDTYQRAIVLAIQRQPGANTVAVADAIIHLLPYFEQLLPPSVTMRVLFDRSQTIRRSVNDVKLTVYIALVLVVLVIFLFLRSLSATVIPSLALPLCLVGTFAFMYLLGYTVDNLSLMAMTLSVGFVVDDAIVMLENIVRHLEHGEAPLEAALHGAREIGFTIISMTLSLAAVFIPILFMGGIIGRLFREFSVVIVLAILISGFISLTLTPRLCSRFLRPRRPERHGRLYQASERVFEAMLSGYKRSLDWVLHHRLAVLVLSVLILLATLLLFKVVPKGFIPDEDNNQVLAVTEAPSAGFGALLTLLVFGVELNLYSFVGLILLIGIVKKNAIMQIDFALAAEREGKSPLEAIYEGCLIRFRPIMMTNFAALMAAIPIALGIGSDARRPLGLAVIGGLLFSQLITLYLTPVYYTYLDAAQQKLPRLAAVFSRLAVTRSKPRWPGRAPTRF